MFDHFLGLALKELFQLNFVSFFLCVSVYINSYYLTRNANVSWWLRIFSSGSLESSNKNQEKLIFPQKKKSGISSLNLICNLVVVTKNMNFIQYCLSLVKIIRKELNQYIRADTGGYSTHYLSLCQGSKKKLSDLVKTFMQRIIFLNYGINGYKFWKKRVFYLQIKLICKVCSFPQTSIIYSYIYIEIHITY